MKSLTFIIFTFFSLAFAVHADEEISVAEKLETVWQNTKVQYLKLDSAYTEKSQWHRPRFFTKNQKKEIVYILHGFMGTPFEMKIFEEKALEKGYDVYNDLIYGYGDNAEMVNLTNNDEWIDLFYKKVAILNRHYEKIHFVGFSTGGLMISHLIFDQQENLKNKLGTITLISPFYESDMFAGNFLLKLVNLFTDTLPSALPYNLIRFPDVVVMMNHPDNFMQKIPLKAAGQVMDLAEKFKSKAQTSIGNFPNMKVYMTPNDRVADYKFTKDYLPKIFTDLEFITLSGERAPHHLMVQSVSEHTKRLKDDFLNN